MVALATMYYCYEENIDEILGMMEIYFVEENHPSHCKFAERWPALAMALGQHQEAFAATPSERDRAFYKAMSEDICIHRRD